MKFYRISIHAVRFINQTEKITIHNVFDTICANEQEAAQKATKYAALMLQLEKCDYISQQYIYELDQSDL